jgi:hypothetical protein
VAKTNFAEVALNTPAYRQYKTQKRRLTSESGLNIQVGITRKKAGKTRIFWSSEPLAKMYPLSRGAPKCAKLGLTIVWKPSPTARSAPPLPSQCIDQLVDLVGGSDPAETTVHHTMSESVIFQAGTKASIATQSMKTISFLAKRPAKL